MELTCLGARGKGHGTPWICQVWGQIPRPLKPWVKPRSPVPCNAGREAQQGNSHISFLIMIHLSHCFTWRGTNQYKNKFEWVSSLVFLCLCVCIECTCWIVGFDSWYFEWKWSPILDVPGNIWKFKKNRDMFLNFSEIKNLNLENFSEGQRKGGGKGKYGICRLPLQSV